MKILRFLAPLLLLCAPAFSQAVWYGSVAQSLNFANGIQVEQPLPGASILVCTYGSTCDVGHMAVIYTDNTAVTTAANPVTADNQGNFGFWASPGTYQYAITYRGVVSGPHTASLGISDAAKTLNSIVYANGFASIAAACTSLGGANGTVIVSVASTISVNTTIPANCNLEFKGGGLVTVSGGSTLTINSSVVAPIIQIFSGTIAGLTSVRPEWFGTSATIKNAVDACATTGCEVYLQNANYRSGFEKISAIDYSNVVSLVKTGVHLHGSGRPQYKSDYTQFVAGTGTIIYPSLYVHASGFTAEHLGVDSGSVVQAAYIPTFTANDSFVVTGALPNDATLYPALTGIVLNDVNCLGKATNTTDHCLLVENVEHATVTNTESVYHTHCAVLKATHSRWSGIYSRGCASDTLIIKGDTYAQNSDNVLSNIVLGFLTTRKDSGGLAITAGTDNLAHLNISNVSGFGLSYGIQIQPQAAGKSLTDVNVSNVVLDGNALPIVSDTDSCLSDTGVNSSFRVRFSNITCNNAAYGANFTSFANNYSVNDAKFTFMYQQAVFSASPTLQLNDISINTNAGGFTTYGIHINGAGATAMVGNVYFIGNAITANFLADGGGAFASPVYPGPLTVNGPVTLGSTLALGNVVSGPAANPATVRGGAGSTNDFIVQNIAGSQNNVTVSDAGLTTLFNAKVGTNGTSYAQDLNCAGAITPASVNATTCAEQTFTIAACSGLATTDTLFVKQSAANTTLAFPVGDWRVSSAGVIARTYCNPTAGALTPTAQTLTIWARH